MPGIPLATTLISIQRATANPETADGYDPPAGPPVTIAEKVRAVISTPSVMTQQVGGERTSFKASMRCDMCDLEQDDTVIDAGGTQWRVLNVVPQQAFALQFLIASLLYVTGASA